MPKITDMDLTENYTIPGVGAFTFSAARPATLTALEYTLVTVVVDSTGSIGGFEADLVTVLKTVYEACGKSPRANNLLLRVVEFNSYLKDKVSELHGFLPLSDIDPNARYTGFKVSGMTNLYDAIYASTKAMTEYGKNLIAQDLIVNAALYIVTDGDDNASRVGVTNAKEAIDEAVKGETLESLHAVLIGINDGLLASKLNQLATDLGLSQYVSVGNLTPGKLAKLAQFVSKSISSQSQALGTGGPSKNLTF